MGLPLLGGGIYALRADSISVKSRDYDSLGKHTTSFLTGENAKMYGGILLVVSVLVILIGVLQLLPAKAGCSDSDEHYW